jgi:hypothetical protein
MKAKDTFNIAALEPLVLKWQKAPTLALQNKLFIEFWGACKPMRDWIINKLTRDGSGNIITGSGFGSDDRGYWDSELLLKTMQYLRKFDPRRKSLYTYLFIMWKSAIFTQRKKCKRDQGRLSFFPPNSDGKQNDDEGKPDTTTLEGIDQARRDRQREDWRNWPMFEEKLELELTDEEADEVLE